MTPLPDPLGSRPRGQFRDTHLAKPRLIWPVFATKWPYDILRDAINLSDVERSGEGIRTTLRAMCGQKFLAATRTHGCSVLLSEELVVGAPLREFTKYVKFKLSRRRP
jgi:hypothetical protein